jgi:hypothetical protein
MVLDIFKGVKDMNKAKREADLEEKVVAASTDHPFDSMKQTN